MRFLPGLICLLPLLSPLAHAELIDDVNDRGELRIALEANTPLFNFKDDTLTGLRGRIGQLLADELDVAPTSSSPTKPTCSGVESGKYDVAINHITTPELKDRFDFSEPYSRVDAQLIAKKDEPRPMLLVQALTEEKPKPVRP
jgi:cystine transport system substrate-binding protein